ncbi:MAG TPA: hypothetical protein VN719_07185 [Gemmatimonadales bacterium]|nr:hypothetical protein [Gemmatimonadales bacterium]
MATGDASDIETRLQRLIPWSWFPLGLAPLYIGIIAGLAAVFSQIYGLIAYVKNQTRLATTTDGFLDLTAYDFFGNDLTRRNGESDPTYSQRISINLFRRRVTRSSVVKILEDLTGRTPTIFEPRRAADTGAYGAPNCGYGMAGGYGSRQIPLQAFITAYRPIGKGIPNVGGYGIAVGGYRVGGQLEYASIGLVGQNVADADIYAAVDSVRPTCATLWTRILS